MDFKDLKGISLDALADEYGQMAKHVHNETEGLRVMTLVFDKSGHIRLVGTESEEAAFGIILSMLETQGQKYFSNEQITSIRSMLKTIASSLLNDGKDIDAEFEKLKGLAAKKGPLNKEDRDYLDDVIGDLLANIKRRA